MPRLPFLPSVSLEIPSMHATSGPATHCNECSNCRERKSTWHQDRLRSCHGYAKRNQIRFVWNGSSVQSSFPEQSIPVSDQAQSPMSLVLEAQFAQADRDAWEAKERSVPEPECHTHLIDRNVRIFSVKKRSEARRGRFDKHSRLVVERLRDLSLWC